MLRMKKMHCEFPHRVYDWQHLRFRRRVAGRALRFLLMPFRILIIKISLSLEDPQDYSDHSAFCAALHSLNAVENLFVVKKDECP